MQSCHHKGLHLLDLCISRASNPSLVTTTPVAIMTHLPRDLIPLLPFLQAERSAATMAVKRRFMSWSQTRISGSNTWKHALEQKSLILYCRDPKSQPVGREPSFSRARPGVGPVEGQYYVKRSPRSLTILDFSSRYINILFPHPAYPFHVPKAIPDIWYDSSTPKHAWRRRWIFWQWPSGVATSS